MMTMIYNVLATLAGLSFLIVLVITFYFFIVRVLTRDAEFDTRDLDELPEISVVIPTYNEENNIRKKLENLKKVNYPWEKLDVKVVDNGSEDSTVEISNEFDVDTVEIGEKGKIKALNHGLEQSDSEYVLFTDADITIDEDSIKNALKYLKGDVKAVTAVSEVECDGWFGKGKEQYHGEDWVQRYRESLLDSVCSMDGKFILFENNVLDELDEEAYVDDLEMTVQLRKNGFRSIAPMDVKVNEETPENLKEDVNMMRRRCKMSIKSSFQNLDVFKDFNFYSYLIFPVRRLMIYFLPIYAFFISVFLLVFYPVLLILLVFTNIVLSFFRDKFRYYNLLMFSLSLSIIDKVFEGFENGAKWD